MGRSAAAVSACCRRQESVSCAAYKRATFCGESCLESARSESHNAHVCKKIAVLMKKQNEFSTEQRTLAWFLIAAYTLQDSKAFAKLLELEGQGHGHKEAAVKELHEFVVELLRDSSDALLSKVS
jgi:hypothetical protein